MLFFLKQPFSFQPFFSSRFISKTWNDVFTIYRPWIVPHQADGSWPAFYVEDSLLLIQSFTESARLISDLCIYSNIFSFGLNMVWAFYCSEVACCLRQENALEIYHGLLMTLPWASFSPSLQDLNRMLEVRCYFSIFVRLKCILPHTFCLLRSGNFEILSSQSQLSYNCMAFCIVFISLDIRLSFIFLRAFHSQSKVQRRKELNLSSFYANYA